MFHVKLADRLRINHQRARNRLYVLDAPGLAPGPNLNLNFQAPAYVPGGVRLQVSPRYARPLLSRQG